MKIFMRSIAVALLASLLNSLPLHAMECLQKTAPEAEIRLKKYADRVKVEHDASEILLKRVRQIVDRGGIPDQELMKEVKNETNLLGTALRNVEHYQSDCTMLLENNMDPILRFGSRAIYTELQELIKKYAPDSE